MDEKEFLGAEVQEAAEPETVGSEENQEVAEPGINEEVRTEEAGNDNSDAAPQRHSDTEGGFPTGNADRAFARMRRELEEKRRNEAVLRAQNTRLSSAMQHFGFNGNTPDEIADAIEAHTSGKSVEEIRSAREAKAREDADIQKLRNENAAFRQREAKRVFDEDLKTVQKLDPNVKNLNELGRDFFALRAQGVSTEVAFNAIKGVRDAQKVTPPPAIGKVNAKTKVERDFFTSDELDKLNSELDDPKVLEKAIRSMTKLK